MRGGFGNFRDGFRTARNPFDKRFKIGDAACAGVVVGDNPGVRRGIPWSEPGSDAVRATGIPRCRVRGRPFFLLERALVARLGGVFSWETPPLFLVAREPGCQCEVSARNADLPRPSRHRRSGLLWLPHGVLGPGPAGLCGFCVSDSGGLGRGRGCRLGFCGRRGSFSSRAARSPPRPPTPPSENERSERPCKREERQP